MPESTTKCSYCGSMMKSSDQYCSGCGAPNDNYIDPSGRRQITKPTTIEELQQYCANRGMPLYKMRFFIGVDTHERRAFGIYRKSNGEVVVYKNKDDGTRAIRYEGPDEAYGVNEIYQKLLSEIAMRQGNRSAGQGTSKKKTRRASFLIGVLGVALLLLISTIISCYTPSRGYYSYNGNTYYYMDGWYGYDDYTDSWESVPSSSISGLTDNYDDYYEGSYYNSNYGASDFEDTSYYQDYESSSSDYDTWDSWDSGGTDWGSDW